MIFEYVVATILISYLLKRSFSALWEVKIKASSLIFGSFIIQIGAMFFYQETAFYARGFLFLITLSYLLLSLGAWLNRDLPGFRIFSFGLFLNFLVIACNGGRMPVSSNALEESNLSHFIEILETGYRKHQLMNDSTVLPFLGDIIPLYFPFALMNMVVSIGDLFITLGMCLFFFLTITESKVFSIPGGRKGKNQARIN
jgi:hypothetical protein